MKLNSALEVLAGAALVLWAVVAVSAHWDVGLADNGDFSRTMEWATTGPVGIEQNWPAEGSEAWTKRFFSYWIPDWKFEWGLAIPRTSAYLLWIPGALADRWFHRDDVLFLPYLSIVPRLLLVAAVVLLVLTIRGEGKGGWILLLALGLPATAMLTATDYLAYLNSFYQETASFVFLLFVVASIVLLRRRVSLPRLAFAAVSILFLATSKPSAVYWPLLAVPIGVLAIRRTGRGRPMGWGVALGVAVGLTFLAGLITRPGSVRANPYNSLFYGALTFSDRPSDHLRRLGLDSAAAGIGSSAFSPAGARIIAQAGERLSFINTAAVISREPAILSRMIGYALGNMQDLSLDYLGKYALDDPRSRAPFPAGEGVETRYRSPGATGNPFDAWGALKFGYFPTGVPLFLVLVIFAAWFWTARKRSGLEGDLAHVGLMAGVGCFTEMVVAVLGDGRYELIKHLFLANLLFDVALIAFIGGVAASTVRRLRPEPGNGAVAAGPG